MFDGQALQWLTKYGCAIVASFVLSAVLATGLYAQVDTGVISGVVTDTSGAVVPDASVLIRNTGTAQVQRLKTGGQGLFVSLPLYAGEYSVEVSKQGFKQSVQQVNLSVSQRIALNFKLTVGATTQVITVRSSLAALQTEKSTLSSLQSRRNIQNLPLNGPNFGQLMGLGAGVAPAQTTYGAGGGNYPITAKRGVIGYSINGMRLEENAFLVDGIYDNENHNGLGIILYPPPDAIEEFREETSVADAQFGGASGGVINLIYKSGTEHYHGDLYEFLRNSSMDARNFFDANIPEFRRNQFGGSLGGPLLPHKNAKTFFFFDYQGVRTRRGVTFISTVPTLLARGGDFSEYPQKIYNPLTDTTLPNGEVQRTQFTNNAIPSSMIDAVGQKLINLYPVPNLPGIANNFTYAPVFRVDENDEDIKINHTFSDHDSGWLRYTHSVTDEFDPGNLPAPAVGGGGADRDYVAASQPNCIK